MIIGPYSAAFISCPFASSVTVLLRPNIVPVGRLTFALVIAVATWSRPIEWADSLRGSTSMRTAYFAAPNTRTCATPLTIEMRCASMFSA